MTALILSLLAFVALVTNLLDNALLRDAQKKLLQHKFEAWWTKVKHYDKLKLALVCASKTNELIDFTFGKALLSRKVLFRCSIISASILLITLSWQGLINRQPFGTAPWTSYKESINLIEKTVDDLTSTNNAVYFTQFNLTTFTADVNASTNSRVVNVNSNLFYFTATTNGIVSISRLYPFGNGSLSVHYDRYFRNGSQTNLLTNSFGNVTSYTDLFTSVCNDLKTFRNQAAKHDTFYYEMGYSSIYFLTLFLANAVLFIVSLAFCRMMLREIAATGRILSTASLIFTNIIAVFFMCCVLLLFLTFLAIPLFWILIPAMKIVADESLYTLAAFLLSAAFSLWLLLGGSAKLIVLIAFLPSAFAITVGLFTLFAMTWRNAFHYVISFILIRCAEKSPIGFVVAIIAFVSGVLVELSHLFHLTEFL